MKLPKGFELDSEGYNEDHILMLHNNVYRQKKYGRVWYQHLSYNQNNELGFTRFSVDECIFYKGKMMYALYTKDLILYGTYQ